MCFCAANKTNCFFFLFISGVSVFGWFCITLTEICYVMPSVSKKSLIFQPETIFCSQISALVVFFLSRLLIAFLLSFDEIRQQKMYRYNDVLCAAFLDFSSIWSYLRTLFEVLPPIQTRNKNPEFFFIFQMNRKKAKVHSFCGVVFLFFMSAKHMHLFVHSHNIWRKINHIFYGLGTHTTEYWIRVHSML